MPYKDPAAQKAAQRKHYEANKALYATRTKATRERRKAALRELKDGPCTDCGVKYPYYVMQFDHIGTDKSFTIGDVVNIKGWQAILDEIDKCELVCANCHAERTHVRFNTGV